MRALRLLLAFLRRITDLLGRYVHAARYFPTVITDKNTIQDWILHARRFQIAFGITILLGILAAPSIPSPDLQRAYWSAGLLTSLSLLWFALPGAARRRLQRQIEGTDPALMAQPPLIHTAADVSVEHTILAVPAAVASPVSAPVGAGDATLQTPALSRYAVEKEVGRGGMGIVYEAHDRTLDRRVALKSFPGALLGRGEAVERFKREAMALARLAHPNIVQVYDLTAADGNICIVMEYVDSGDLAGLMEKGPMDRHAVLRIAAQLARALAYAHAQGIIHRDFKPENVLMTRDGVPKIMDFGLAKMSEKPNMTVQGSIMGSPRYMSPEQARGHGTDERTDIYSFGVTLYEMLCGAPPFEGDTMAILYKHVHEEPPPIREKVPDLPEPLAVLVERMMAKDPALRPAAMTEIVEILESLT